MTKVLVIEDNANLAFGLTRSLESEGYEVESAEDGRVDWRSREAVARISIVLDLMLPEIDGYSHVRQLREGGSDVPVLITHRPQRRSGQGCWVSVSAPMTT